MTTSSAPPLHGRPPARILLYEANLDGTVGGSHKALYDLATSLDRTQFVPVVVFLQENKYVGLLRSRGIEVHDLSARVDRELTLRRTAGRGRKLADMARGIVWRARFLREQRIALLHLNNVPIYGGTDWAPAARLIGIPVVSSIMGWFEGPMRPTWRLSLRLFNAFLPVSRIIADRWIAYGAAAERIRLVHHGVSIEEVRARCNREPEAVRREFGVPTGTVLVVMGGNVRRWKGQHVVLDALAQLSPTSRGLVRVLFAGASSAEDAPYVAELGTQVRKHGLEETVSFLGFRDDLPALLKAADIVLHASIHPEPGGIVVMEAMALGAAIIAADQGGHTEVMTEGCGFTFDTRVPAQLTRRLEQLIGDPQLRRQVGDRAVDRVAEFSIPRNAAETQAVYRECLGR